MAEGKGDAIADLEGKSPCSNSCASCSVRLHVPATDSIISVSVSASSSGVSVMDRSPSSSGEEGEGGRGKRGRAVESKSE